MFIIDVDDLAQELATRGPTTKCISIPAGENKGVVGLASNQTWRGKVHEDNGGGSQPQDGSIQKEGHQSFS
jgi:hypothetical protein